MPPTFKSRVDALKRASIPAPMVPSKLAAFYTRFRGSSTFLKLLLATIAGWLAVHFTWRLDPELGGINLFLSSEASVSLAFVHNRNNRGHF